MVGGERDAFSSLVAFFLELVVFFATDFLLTISATEISSLVHLRSHEEEGFQGKKSSEWHSDAFARGKSREASRRQILRSCPPCSSILCIHFLSPLFPEKLISMKSKVVDKELRCIRAGGRRPGRRGLSSTSFQRPPPSPEHFSFRDQGQLLLLDTCNYHWADSLLDSCLSSLSNLKLSSHPSPCSFPPPHPPSFSRLLALSRKHGCHSHTQGEFDIFPLLSGSCSGSRRRMECRQMEGGSS